MRRPLLLLAGGAAILAGPVPAAAGAAAPRVQVMVVGKERVLRHAARVTADGTRVRVGRRRCRVAAATPLAALVRTRLSVGLRDFGSCGRDVRDAGGLYVTRVRADRARGSAGWVYKVGRRLGTAGAADLAGPFGTGRRLASGDRLLWFWCSLDSAGGCRRTLEVRASTAKAAPGETVTLTVRGYDDRGRSIAVSGATVRAGRERLTTDGSGRARLVVRGVRGTRLRVVAERPDMVRSFPVTVRVA